MYLKFFKHVTSLVNLNKRFRLTREHIRGILSPVEWASEFCTVQINAGRQIGKTSYICRYATERDLIIVPTETIRRTIANRVSSLVTIITPNTLVNLHSYRGKHFDTVYVDEPEHVFKHIDRQVMYEKLSHLDITFVLLGSQ